MEENLGAANPNGTSFAITLRPAPELDPTNLVVGRVVSGLDVVQQLANLPSVKANKDSPYFKCALACCMMRLAHRLDMAMHVHDMVLTLNYHYGAP